MAALLAMQAAAGWPGMPVFNPLSPPAPVTPVTGKDPSVQRKPVEKKVGERCKDYDEKGYCMQGDMCPYEHGMDHIVIAGQEQQQQQQQSPLDEYDPNNSQLFPVTLPTHTANGGSDRGSIRGGNSTDRGRGGSRGRGGAMGRGGRSMMSSTGPNFDKSNTTLVVEHIPEDKLDETSVTEFFSAFGPVSEVSINKYRKLATIKFERWDQAKKAYDSPAAIFDNRFVKVFWQKQDPMSQQLPSRPSNVTPGSVVPARGKSPPPQLSKLADEGEIDMEEFKRKSEEAQKAYEAKVARKKLHEEATKELERKKEELLRMEKEQKRILMAKLAKRKSVVAKKPAVVANSAKAEEGAAGTVNGSSSTKTAEAADASQGEQVTAPTIATLNPTTTTTTSAATDTETEALRAQLEALEAEAKSLGIDQTWYDPSSADATTSYRGRGRGLPFRGGTPRVFRGAASRGRGGYHSPYVPPGTGAPYFRGGRGRGGGAMRLDNRTKRVSVAVKGGMDAEGRDEALRQYLLGVGEFEGIEVGGGKEGGGAVVTFKDRLTAEKVCLVLKERWVVVGWG